MADNQTNNPPAKILWLWPLDLCLGALLLYAGITKHENLLNLSLIAGVLLLIAGMWSFVVYKKAKKFLNSNLEKRTLNEKQQGLRKLELFSYKKWLYMGLLLLIAFYFLSVILGCRYEWERWVGFYDCQKAPLWAGVCAISSLAGFFIELFRRYIPKN